MRKLILPCLILSAIALPGCLTTQDLMETGGTVINTVAEGDTIQDWTTNIEGKPLSEFNKQDLAALLTILTVQVYYEMSVLDVDFKTAIKMVAQNNNLHQTVLTLFIKSITESEARKYAE